MSNPPFALCGILHALKLLWKIIILQAIDKFYTLSIILLSYKSFHSI